MLKCRTKNVKCKKLIPYYGVLFRIRCRTKLIGIDIELMQNPHNICALFIVQYLKHISVVHRSAIFL